jgi:hypothetical protein
MQGSNGEKYIVMKITGNEHTKKMAGEDPVSAEFDGESLIFSQANGDKEIVFTSYTTIKTIKKTS